MNFKKFFVFLMLIQNFSLFPKDNLVIIKGRKKQKTQSFTSSHSHSFSKDNLDSQNLDQHIQAKPSLKKESETKISDDDFSRPQIRGQRSRSTEFWLNDGLLYNPWTALPFDYSFHGEQFSSIHIHEGLSPFLLPSANPFGIIHYKKYHYQNSTRFGLKLGSPLGQSFWGVLERKKVLKKNIDFGLFLNLHQTRGDYKYYSENSTPFTPENGEILTLKNNEQKNFFISPYFRWKSKKLTFENYSFVFFNKRNLVNLQKEDPLKKDSLSFLSYQSLRLKVSQDKKNLKPNLLGLDITEQIGDLSFKNAENKTEQNSKSFRFSLSSVWKKEKISLKSTSSYGIASFKQDKNNLKHRSNRSYFENYLGFQSRFSYPLNFEGKSLIRFSKSAEKEDISFSYGGTLFWKEKTFLIYTQAAHVNRLPSLLEEQGNSYEIQEATDLSPEKNLHFEFGFLKKGVQTYSFVTFFDLCHDKIVFFPASFQRFKASNLTESRTFGSELSHSFSQKNFEFSSSLGLLFNLDSSDSHRTFFLPNSPFYTFSNSFSWSPGDFSFLLCNRLIGHQYKDLANTIMIDPHSITDISLSYTYKIKKTSVGIKFSLNNLFDTNSLYIQTVGSNPSFGKIARTGLYGSPVPSRTWILALEAKI